MNFDFSALNFETIDSNINAYPDMFLNQNGVTFTKKVLEDLGYPAFVLCLLDAKARVFAIRSCMSNEPKGFKFSKPRGEQKGVVTISNKNLLDPLRAVLCSSWQLCVFGIENGHLSLYSEKATSPFSPSLRLWKPWKTASGLRTVPTACAHPLFPLWLSLFSLKIRDYSASLLGVTGRKSS